MVALVGYTGFVGSNIYEAAGHEIDAVFNSKNIEKAYGLNPDVLIYSGLRAEKYLANQDSEKDLELILQAEENITKINPKKLVLISTIDVFKTPTTVDETSNIVTEDLHPYGYNRYQMELWVRAKYKDALIIRLPGLFGKNIKKNFIYDYINVIPFMIKKDKFLELQKKEQKLNKYYTLQENGFYKVQVSETEKDELRNMFKKLGFSALDFTDSRSSYQFYNLAHLWEDIKTALDHNILLWHPANEPVSANMVYEFLTGKKFVNELNVTPVKYDYRTIHNSIFGGENGYIQLKHQVLEEIKAFVEGEIGRENTTIREHCK